MNSIAKEMAEVGIQSRGAEDLEGFIDGRNMSTEEFERYKLDTSVGAIVVGMDTKYTYAKLSIASMYVHTGGAKFIATNDDAYDMVGDRRMPGAGAMVQSIQYTLGQIDTKS